MAEDRRLTYESPRALRLGAKPSAAGDCQPAGSGDALGCWYPGSSAEGDGCGMPGNSAFGYECFDAGNSAFNSCEEPGSGF